MPKPATAMIMNSSTLRIAGFHLHGGQQRRLACRARCRRRTVVRRKAARSLSRTSSPSAPGLSLIWMSLTQADARGRVDHAAQLLQLADRHEDERRVVLAHLAFVEIDDREVVADGLRRLAGGGEGELHVVAGNDAEPVLARRACGSWPWRCPARRRCAAVSPDRSGSLGWASGIGCEGIGRWRSRRRGRRSAVLPAASRRLVAGTLLDARRAARGGVPSRRGPSAFARARRRRPGGRGRRSRLRADRNSSPGGSPDAASTCRNRSRCLASFRRCRSVAPAA